MLADIKRGITADWKRLGALLGQYSTEIGQYAQRQGNVSANDTIRAFYVSEIARLKGAGANGQQLQPLINARDANARAKAAQTGFANTHLSNATKIRNSIAALTGSISKSYNSLLVLEDKQATALVTDANSRAARANRLALTAFNGLPHKIVFSRSIPITGGTTAQPAKPINAALVGIASGSLVGGIPGALLGGVIGYLIKRSKHE